MFHIDSLSHTRVIDKREMLTFYILILTLLPLIVNGHYTPLFCRCQPDQACWPSEASWTALNASIVGNLAKVQPLGTPCHVLGYDATRCEEILARANYSAYRSSYPGLSPSRLETRYTGGSSYRGRRTPIRKLGRLASSTRTTLHRRS